MPELLNRYNKQRELLRRCYKAFARNHWEEGETETELASKISDYLDGEKMEEEFFGELVEKSELQKLRDDSEALQLLSTLKGKNGDIFLSVTSGFCEVIEAWEDSSCRISEYRIREISDAPTPLAAVKAAQQKLEQKGE